MHEQGLCHTLLRRVLDIAAQYHARKIVSVEVTLGPWSGIQEAQLRHAFDEARSDTIAADARLRVVHDRAVVNCLDCGQSGTTDAAQLLCPQCQSERVRILNGSEMMITDIELVN